MHSIKNNIFAKSLADKEVINHKKDEAPLGEELQR